METGLKDHVTHVKNYLSHEHHLFGCALLRIGVGSIVLYYFAGHWAERMLIWGPEGLYPYWLFVRELSHTRWPSLFAVTSPRIFNLWYILAIVTATLYTLGIRTRLVAIPFAIFTSSLLARDPLALTGGDNLVLVQLPFLLLLNTSAHLSLDARRRRSAGPTNPYLALIHNAALFGMMFQLALMYGCSGLAKVTGEPWQHGTAVYYVLQTREFGMSFFANLFTRNAAVVVTLTYTVIGFELAFPFLIWSRKTRWIATLGAIALHGSIAIFMRLLPFAAEALIFQFILYSDDDYRLALRILSGAAHALMPRARVFREPSEASSSADLRVQ